jgi:HEAT repeat protein
MSRKNWPNEKVFFRLVNNKSDRTYWDNIRELRKRPTSKTFNKCVEFLKTKSAKKRVIAIDVLAQLGVSPRPYCKETVHLLFKGLERETDEKVIWSALYALGHNNEGLSESQISFLTKFQNNSSFEVRFALVHSLLGLESQTAVDTLIFLSKDSKSAVRDWATFGIGSQIGIDSEKIRHALWVRTEDSDKITRFEGIAGLAQRKDPRIKDMLKNELEKIDNHGSVILESIEEYCDKDFVPLLEHQIETNKKTNQVSEEWLTECLETLKANLEQLP